MKNRRRWEKKGESENNEIQASWRERAKWRECNSWQLKRKASKKWLIAKISKSSLFGFMCKFPRVVYLIKCLYFILALYTLLLPDTRLSLAHYANHWVNSTEQGHPSALHPLCNASWIVGGTLVKFASLIW